MHMRQFTKSALTLPWAITMFGVQQLSNLAAPSGHGLEGAAAAFDAVADAAEQQLDGWVKQTYRFGSNLQQTVVDLLSMRAPAVDSV